MTMLLVSALSHGPHPPACAAYFSTQKEKQKYFATALKMKNIPLECFVLKVKPQKLSPCDIVSKKQKCRRCPIKIRIAKQGFWYSGNAFAEILRTNGRTPLLNVASYAGDIDFVVNLSRHKHFNKLALGVKGENALHAAAGLDPINRVLWNVLMGVGGRTLVNPEGRKKVLIFLINNKYPFKKSTLDGKTPLHVASIEDNVYAFNILYTKPRSMELDYFGMSPIQYAVISKSNRVMKFLYGKGVKVHEASICGVQAANIAKHLDDSEMLKILNKKFGQKSLSKEIIETANPKNERKEN